MEYSLEQVLNEVKIFDGVWIYCTDAKDWNQLILK